MNKKCEQCDYFPERPTTNKTYKNKFNMCLDCKFLYEDGLHKTPEKDIELKNHWAYVQYINCKQCDAKIRWRTSISYSEINMNICDKCEKTNKKEKKKPILPLILLEMEALLCNVAYARERFDTHEGALLLLLKKYIKEISLGCEGQIKDESYFVKMFRQVDVVEEPVMDSVLWTLLNSSVALWRARENVIAGTTIFQQKR